MLIQISLWDTRVSIYKTCIYHVYMSRAYIICIYQCAYIVYMSRVYITCIYHVYIYHVYIYISRIYMSWIYITCLFRSQKQMDVVFQKSRNIFAPSVFLEFHRTKNGICVSISRLELCKRCKGRTTYTPARRKTVNSIL